MNSHSCPVCGGRALKRFLQRSRVPVHQNLIMESQRAARDVVRGDLDLNICEECGFVSNRAFDLAKLSYGDQYDNTQSCSSYFESHMDRLVREIVDHQGMRDCTIVEVGCGRGQFLRMLVEHPGANNTGFGFDPSYIGPLTSFDGRLQFRTSYYDDSCTDIAADVVVCRHVIEHVPEPLKMLRSIRAALASSPKARVFFETPCVEWILRNRVVWDFFYEHCSIFTADSLSLAFRRAGFQIERVDHIFGGQYLWLEARVGDVDHTLPAAAGMVSLASAYGADEQDLKALWLKRLDSLREKGQVALWGAGAKGATFANLIDPECSLIDCVVDLNPNKQGRFIPGSGHPIVAPGALPDRGVHAAVLMNPNYRSENLRILADSGISVDLLDWSDA